MEQSQELMAAREEIQAMMARARAAQAQIADYTQEQVDELITAMVWAVAQEERSEKIAQFTVDETQLGNYAGKYLKIHRKTRATLMDIINDRSVGVIEEDPERNIVKIAINSSIENHYLLLHRHRDILRLLQYFSKSLPTVKLGSGCFIQLGSAKLGKGS